MARFSLVLIAVYAATLVAVLPPVDRSLFGWGHFDALPLYAALVALGPAYAVAHRVEALKWAWVLVLTVAALGRALTLVLVGSPALTPGRELAGAVSWGVVLCAGLLSALVLTAETILRPGR